MAEREGGPPPGGYGSSGGYPGNREREGWTARDEGEPAERRREVAPGFRPEPGAAPASGGHLPPETAAGPLFDPLVDPIPSAPDVERTSVVPPAVQEPRPRPMPRRGSERRRRVAIRRVRRTIRHVDPMSVLKVSLFFYACFLVLWLIFVAIAYAVLSSTGFFDAIEDFGGPEGLVLWQRLDITLFFVERWAFLLGLTFSVLATVINVFLSFLYNVAADTVGGVEMTFVEREY